MSAETHLEAAAERARATHPGTLSAAATITAQHCLLDWFACAIAGANSDAAHAMRAVVPALSAGGAGVVGDSGRRSTKDAALLNGVAAHALDFDDLHPHMSTHASVAIVPALLAVAEDRVLSVEQVLTSLVAGVEFGAEVGRLISPRHYREGWHTTGSVGAIAAAAAIAHLTDLDAAQFRTATALASTLGGGLRTMFGTMAKPLHAGRAASSGVLAGMLAAERFTAARDGLTGPLGFVTMFSDPEQGPPPLRSDEAITDTVFKLVAACTGTHASVANARAALRRTGIGVDDVARVEVWVSPENESVCGIEQPRTGTEAKFSLRATTAMAFLGWDLADESSYEAGAESPDVAAFAERIVVSYEPAMLGRPFFSKMRLTPRAGESVFVEADASLPERDLEVREEQLTTKLFALANPSIGSGNVSRLAGLILGEPDAPVSDLMALVSD
ncbi:MmgE/PrpD family protein [Microbacterium sp.]|uniref:MmgE/PrpD family protein n=1 Tax=Microbacterium sp. TaxID=51671 RepID=UPI003A91CEB4